MIDIEFDVVLQRHRALEPTIGGAQLDVPGIVGGFQDPRPARLGSASTNVPSCYSGTPRAALRCLTTINSAFHLYPPSLTKKIASRATVCTTSQQHDVLDYHFRCTTKSCSVLVVVTYNDLFYICTCHTLPVVTSSYNFRTQ